MTPLPSGFIFAFSSDRRSVPSEALATLRCECVPAAPAVVDALRSADPQPKDLRRAMRIEGGADHYIVIFDALQAVDIAQVERAFPDVPWVFVYRNPLEELTAHHAKPNASMSVENAPAALGIDVSEARTISNDEYAARILGRIYDSVNRASSRLGLLVHRDELPAAAFERMAPHFGIASAETGSVGTDAAARNDAEVAPTPSPEVREAARRYCAASYAALEARRFLTRATAR